MILIGLDSSNNSAPLSMASFTTPSSSTILHYSSNSDNIRGTDLVLVDAGCEVNGYASDITRTWPVSGMFSEAQREIYELVLRAEL